MAKFSLSDSLKVRNQIEKEQYQMISKLYQDMAKEAKSQAEKMGKGTASDRLQAAELKKLAKQLQDEAKSIGVKLEKGISDTLLRTSQAVVGDAVKFNQSMGLTVEGAYRRVPSDIVEVLVSGRLYEGKWSLSKAIWADIKHTQQDINTVVAEGLALNRSSYDIAKDLERYVDPNAKKPWDWSKVYPGTKRKVDYNAQRLARTMIGHAYQQSVVATCRNDPFVDGVKWISGHTSSSCEICEERDGKVFPVDQLPLDHPNGKCSFAPAMSKDLTQIADELADWVQGGSNPRMDQWYGSMSPESVVDKSTRKFSNLNKQIHKQWANDSRVNQEVGTPEYEALYGGEGFQGYVDGNSKMVNSLLAGFEFYSPALTTAENIAARAKITWENLGDQIRRLDSAISMSGLPQDSKLYRVIDDKTMKGVFGVTHRTKMDKIFDSVVGNTYTQDSFMSTSIGVDPLFKKYPCIMTLEVPKGTPSVVTTNFKEGEILLGRGTRYEVVGVVDHKNDPLKVPSVGRVRGEYTEYSGLELICRIVEE